MNALKIEVILDVDLEKARLERLHIGCPSSDSSSEGISRDLIGLRLEDSTFSFPYLLKYLPNFSKMSGFSATNSTILVRASSLVGWIC